jgi:hypothetical protein
MSLITEQMGGRIFGNMHSLKKKWKMEKQQEGEKLTQTPLAPSQRQLIQRVWLVLLNSFFPCTFPLLLYFKIGCLCTIHTIFNFNF